MRKIIYYTTLPILLFMASLWCISHASAKVSLGYQEVSPHMSAFSVPGRVTLTEFFSYGCPACYAIEPQLEAWLRKHKDIVFYRVPSLFRPEWVIYAKAYYTAKHLDISEKVTPALFKAVQDEGRDLSTPEKMADFFATYGIDKSKFKAVFDFAPEIDGQVARADNLFHQYKIFAIPTFVVNGQFLTNAEMTGNSNDKLFEVLETLARTTTTPPKQ
jgi:protein dithiol oxidoreductase (disulfide-forming)